MPMGLHQTSQFWRRFGATPSRPWLTLWVAGLMIAVGVTAQTKQSAAADASSEATAKLLTRYLEASGGEAAIRKQTSRLSKGAFESPNLPTPGTVEILQAAPRKSLQKIGVNESMVITLGTDGTNAWLNIPGAGVQDFDARQREQFINDSDIFRILSFSQRYTKLLSQAPSRVGSVECDVVLGVTREGQTDRLYFGRDDGLLRRWDRTAPGPAGQLVQMETYMDDYRTVDGLKLPFKISQPVPADQAFTLVLTEIKHGVEAPESKFQRPQ